jgi:hypothetical protein
VLYARDTLARMEAEQRQFAHDPKAKTPTVWALDKLETHEIAPMTSAAATLSRNVEELPFKGEKADTWNGKPARVLELSLVEPNPDEEHMKIKESTHTARVWTTPDGTPLGAHITHKRRASVMVLISFEQVSKENFIFGVSGDRLVVLQRDEQGTASGLGTEADYRNTYTFEPAR